MFFVESFLFFLLAVWSLSPGRVDAWVDNVPMLLMHLATERGMLLLTARGVFTRKVLEAEVWGTVLVTILRHINFARSLDRTVHYVCI